MRVLRKIHRFLHSVKTVYKNGGIVNANITYCTPTELLIGKRILITGGSSGIGYYIARKSIECGAEVIITGRNEQKLHEAVKNLSSHKCHGLVWDHSNISIVSDKLREAIDILGDIDILVNNAGVAPSKFFGQIDEIEWNRIYDTNLKGGYFLIQEIVRQWKNISYKGYKKIINMSSQGGYVGATYPYRMTKWDVRGLTEGLGIELIKDNIIVNGIAPGIVKTAMQDFSLKQGNNLYTDQNPIKRVCLPEEIAELAAFLMSDTSNFIIGQTIVCDGGYILK